jgi:hypothetical protein
MKRFEILAALCAAVTATQVGAQGHGGMQQDMTRAQAQQQADAMFQRFDVNHDGVITRQEAEQAAAQYGAGGRAERMIDRIFGDSQSITQQQFEAQALARFDRDDANHDGVVTSAEREEARAQLKAERAAQTPGK